MTTATRNKLEDVRGALGTLSKLLAEIDDDSLTESECVGLALGRGGIDVALAMLPAPAIEQPA